jgi:hypothetical protein
VVRSHPYLLAGQKDSKFKRPHKSPFLKLLAKTMGYKVDEARFKKLTDRDIHLVSVPLPVG